MHVLDGLLVDEEGARIVRAAETIMVAIPRTNFLEALHQVEMARQNAGHRNARIAAIASRTAGATDAQTMRTSFSSSSNVRPEATRSDVYYVTEGIAEPTWR